MGKERVAVVEFINNTYGSSKQYFFKIDLDEVMSGDLVVVDTANGYQVVKVLGFQDLNKLATKWVVSKVDLESHQIRLEKEKKVELLKQKMEKRRKQIEEIQIYRMMAQEDTEMAKLLKELEVLG